MKSSNSDSELTRRRYDLVAFFYGYLESPTEWIEARPLSTQKWLDQVVPFTVNKCASKPGDGSSERRTSASSRGGTTGGRGSAPQTAGRHGTRTTDPGRRNNPPDPKGSFRHRAKDADLAGTRLEEHISEVFRRRLKELDGEAKEGFVKILKTSSDPVLIRSAFELPSEQRVAIEDALNETFSTEIDVRFETAAEMISGIELIANGRKVAWSIAEYLMSLEKSIGELLQEQAKPKSKPEAEPEPEKQAGLKPKSGTQTAAAEEAE